MACAVLIPREFLCGAFTEGGGTAMFSSCHISLRIMRTGWFAAAAVLVMLGLSGPARGNPDMEQFIAEARAQLVKQKAALVADEALLGEALAEPAGPERDRLVQLAEQTREQQRRAVTQAQERLDKLLGCAEKRQQLERDLALLDRQQASIKAAAKELQEWTTQNEEAQHAAVRVATNLLVDGILGKFVESFDAQIEQGVKELRSMPTNRFDRRFLDDLVALRVKTDRLKTERDILKLAQTGKSSFALWNMLAAFSQQSHHTAVEITDLVRKLASNKLALKTVEMSALLAAANQFERRIIKAKFPLIGNAAKLGNFLVDYGYEAVRWTASRNRILQANSLTEQQLAAVEALGCQLERSMHHLRQCRGEPVPALRESCQRGAK